MRKLPCTLLLLGGCSLALLLASPVAAQDSVRSAGSKITGSAYREWSTQSYGRAATGHAETLNEYARRYSYIPSETAAEHAAEVRRNVASAKKELAKLAPQAKTNKTLAKHLDTIHGHYDKALEHASAVEKESAKNDKADTKKVGASASGLTESLNSADAEHKKLVEHLQANEKK